MKREITGRMRIKDRSNLKGKKKQSLLAEQVTSVALTNLGKLKIIVVGGGGGGIRTDI